MNFIPPLKGLVDMHGNTISSEKRGEILSQKKSLPIQDKVSEILSAVQENPITLVESGTGNGKSTQLPQVMYDHLHKQGVTNPRIISCAPRVAATLGLADRVWLERFCETGNSYWNLGRGVGYATGRGKNFSLDSSILYHTSGYEMMRIFQGGQFPDVLILDEFHTDDIANMMLAYAVREELLNNKHHCKVIITSATMNRLKTLEYFGDISENIPVIEAPGKTFPVKTIEAPSHTYMDHVREQLLQGNNTLIFAAGKKEIEQDMESIKDMLGEGFEVYAFHADISLEEQEKVRTLNPEDGTYIVIAATNSAQESLTVPCIQTIIDKGWVKVSSVDEHGVPRLDLQPVTLSEQKQRKGRVGRVAKGTAILLQDEESNNREKFPTPPITQITLEREILLLLKYGHNMSEILTEHYAENTKMFVDNPSPELVELSYERLYRMGAIDKQGITKLGENILTFPVSVFHSRMLFESIKRGVSEDMIEIVAILENKGFLLPQGKWKEAYNKEKSNSQKSDMFFQLSIFRTLCAYEHKEGTLNFLSDVCGLGFEWRKKFEEGESMLFECIPEEVLEEFGVVKRSLQKMADTVDELYDRFETQDIEVTNVGDKDDIIISILSGNLHNIFAYSYDNKNFTNAFFDWGAMAFEKTNTSIIKCDEQKSGGFYVGSPFIIGGRDGEDDMPLLTSLTRVEEGHIEVFKDMLYGETPNYNFQKQTEQTRARNTYRAEIQKEVKFSKFDAEKIKQKLTKTFFSYIEETSPDYSYFFSSVSDMGKNTEEYESLIHSFENAKVLEQKLLKEQKKNSWIESFIKDCEQVIEGNGTSSLTKISLGASSKERLLLSDMVIKEFDFISRANHQKHLYTSIRSFLCALEPESLSKEQKDMYLSSFANMYSLYSQNFGGAIKKAKDFVRSLKISVVKNKDIISTLQAEQEINKKVKHLQKIKSNIKYLEKTNKKIGKIIDDVQCFTQNAESMRNDIESIDFQEVVYRHFKEPKGRTIFTKKYLYSVLGSIIFNGDFITPDLLTENKLLTRMSQNFGETLEDKESIERLLVAIKNVLSKGVSDESDSKSKEYIKECIEKITTYCIENLSREDDILQDLTGERNKHMHLQQYLYNLLCEFFDEEFIKRKEGRILQCIRHILAQSNTNNLDTILQELILSFSFSQSIEYGDMFKDIDTYTHNLDTIKKTYKGTIKRQIKKGELSALEIEEETLAYKKLIKETSILEKRIQEQLQSM